MFRSPFWLAAAVPVLGTAWGLLAWGAARRRRIGAALGRDVALSRSAEEAGARRRLAAGLRLAAVALLLLALAGPQWGIDLVETRGAARQVVVAVDVSLSMQTPDVKPSRLERAKASLSLLLDQLKGDRVGVVAFAGDAQVVCPLTSDVDAAKELLGALEVGAVPTPGTSIGGALRLATAMIGRYPGSKSVVLLTDGEDHKSDPLGAAKEAAASGVRLFTVGIGSPEGEPIPLEGGGYKKDVHGATVVSRLGEGTLEAMAKTAGGEYFRSSPGEDEITDIAARIKEGETAKGLTGTAARWRDRYAWPLGAAFLLLLIEMGLAFAPPRRATTAAAALLLLAGAGRASGATFEGRLRDANKTYAGKDYETALEQYGDASGLRPADPRPVFNAGDALYRLDRATDAAGAFGSVADRRETPANLRAAALYNLGNSRYQLGDYAGAADAYRRALTLSPSDADARRNLVIALNRKKNPPPPKKTGPKSQQQQKNPPPDQPKDKKGQGGGGGGAGPAKPRPQDSLTREDAERVMRAVAEREKAERKQAPPTAAYGRKPPPPKPPTEEDW